MTDTEHELRKEEQMPVRLPEVTVKDGEWPCKDDLLKRDGEIEHLSRMLLNTQSPLVMGLDSPWGGGKTTFINMWASYLKMKGFVCLNLNAWESDFSGDPLLPLLTEVDRRFVELAQNLDDAGYKTKIYDSLEELKKLGPELMKSAVFGVVKAATSGVLDLREVSKATDSDSNNDLMGDYKAMRSVMKQFRDNMEKIVACLPEGQGNLIVFVDELDRCVPTYAVMMLERIKHLFNVEGLVFVLAINSDQLCQAIQGVYGSEFDGRKYLRRFVDFDYHLRIPSIDDYVKSRFNQEDIMSHLKRQGTASYLEWMCETASLIVRHLDYQLRDIDQLVIRTRLMLNTISQCQVVNPVVLVSLLMLRSHKPDLYRQYLEEPELVNEVITELTGVESTTEYLPAYFGRIAGSMIKAAIGPCDNDRRDYVVEPWRQRLSALPLKGSSKLQLDDLFNELRSLEGFHRTADVNKFVSEQIELMNNVAAK